MNKSYLKTKVYQQSRSLSQSRVTLRNESFESSYFLHLDLHIGEGIHEKLVIKDPNQIEKKVKNLSKKYKLNKRQKDELIQLVEKSWYQFEKEALMDE
jgi:hypothetical protein